MNQTMPVPRPLGLRAFQIVLALGGVVTAYATLRTLTFDAPTGTREVTWEAGASPTTSGYRDEAGQRTLLLGGDLISDLRGTNSLGRISAAAQHGRIAWPTPYAFDEATGLAVHGDSFALAWTVDHALVLGVADARGWQLAPHRVALPGARPDLAVRGLAWTGDAYEVIVEAAGYDLERERNVTHLYRVRAGDDALHQDTVLCDDCTLVAALPGAHEWTLIAREREGDAPPFVFSATGVSPLPPALAAWARAPLYDVDTLPLGELRTCHAYTHVASSTGALQPVPSITREGEVSECTRTIEVIDGVPSWRRVIHGLRSVHPFGFAIGRERVMFDDGNGQRVLVELGATVATLAPAFLAENPARGQMIATAEGYLWLDAMGNYARFDHALRRIDPLPLRTHLARAGIQRSVATPHDLSRNEGLLGWALLGLPMMLGAGWLLSRGAPDKREMMYAILAIAAALYVASALYALSQVLPLM